MKWEKYSKKYLAAAAKLLQLCLTLCDPTDGSPPGSTIPGILQARTLEWVAISFSTTLLQHVDDLLLCSSSCHNYLVHTATVLNALGNWGQIVSLSKAQTASTTVNYMGLLLTPTSKIIPAQRFHVLTQTSRPQTKRELLSLLGLLNFFQIWVPNFALHAKPLYQATRGNLDEPLLAPISLRTPIQTIIKHLLQAPSLYLPDYTKPFFLFVHYRQGHALGILCQKRGDIWGPLAYLSKQLDLITSDGHLVSRSQLKLPSQCLKPKN